MKQFRYLATTLLPAHVAIFAVALASAVAEESPDRSGLEFFEAKIRPVLAAKCYECHSAEAAAGNKLKGKLLLDTRTAPGAAAKPVRPSCPERSKRAWRSRPSSTSRSRCRRPASCPTR